THFLAICQVCPIGAPERARINPDFRTDPTRADIAMQIRDYSKSFEAETPPGGRLELFDNIEWDVAGGQRWALIGPNGCGKTTLLRDIVGEGDWRNKIIRIGPSLEVGYCAQQQEVLDGDNTVFEELMSIKDANKEKVLGILARFLFRDEEVYKKISHLSGGERNRLQLARLMLLKCNFLILDEPTNHLDIPTREAVEQALAEFKGTILVVSHDRYFLDKVVDRVAEVHERGLRFYEGNFTNYWQSRQEGSEGSSGRITRRSPAARQNEATKSKEGGRAWQQRKAQSAALRKARKAAEEIEQLIHQAEQQKQHLQQQIAEAFTKGENEQGTELSRQLDELTVEIKSLYRQWEQADKDFNEMERSINDLGD
ncbi:ATP-binding cassette domain-containing protein, partial [Planctomycetota bacterium]